MRVGDQNFRTVWMDGDIVRIIDQRKLPFEFVIETLHSVEDVAVAIREMHVRGAGCIGAAAAYGMVLATAEASASADFAASIKHLANRLIATRPTATNLSWAVERILNLLNNICSTGNGSNAKARLARCRQEADSIADEDVDACERIGGFGLQLIREIAANKPPGEAVQILTHCNAGWLAFVDHGSATAPIYAARRAGIPLHVWVDETRPRNQGARLTAWELANEDVPHTVIVDNAGGHLMQRGLVDLVIVGSDRTSRNGDVANKIGTYLKALAAEDNGVPFYVALPSSTFDWNCSDGLAEIPIEERDQAEVIEMDGIHSNGQIGRLRITESVAANPAFDVTPARLVTGLISERGICAASSRGIEKLYPERRPSR